MNKQTTEQARKNQKGLDENMRLKHIIGNALLMLGKPAEYNRTEVKDMLNLAFNTDQSSEEKEGQKGIEQL